MPAFARTAADGTIEHWCVRCQQYLPPSSFAPSSIARRLSRCSKCRSRIELERRRRTPAAHLAHKLYESERMREGARGQLFSPEFAQRVLDRYNGKSVISGKTAKLALHPFWPDVPACEWNVVLVTEDEARALGRMTNPFKRYPEALVRDMLKELEEHS